MEADACARARKTMPILACACDGNAVLCILILFRAPRTDFQLRIREQNMARIRKLEAGELDDQQMRLAKEIGGLAVYLASEASSFMTGSVLVLDGGKLLW